MEPEGPGLGPLRAAGPVILGHAAAALAAFVLGTVQMLAPKGTGPHRALGRIWVALMAGVALSSFASFELRVIGPFSPIHLLSAITLVSLAAGLHAARVGDVERHRKAMLSLYVLALVLTGAFTLLPGRAMHAVLFGS